MSPDSEVDGPAPARLVPLAAVGLSLLATYVVYLPLTAHKGVGFPVLADLWRPARMLGEALNGTLSLAAQRDLLRGLPAVRLALYLVGLWLARGHALERLRPVVLTFAGLFLAVLFLQPGTMSSDVDLYVVFGRMQVAGLSPYRVPMSQSHDALLPWFAADSSLNDLPLYGPFWMLLCRAVAMATASLPGQLLLMRALLAAAAMGLILVVDRILRILSPAWHPVGLCLFAWNPLLLMELGGEAHNDALSLLALGCAILLAARDRHAAAAAAATLSLGIKMSGLPVLVGLLLIAARRRRWDAFAAAAGVLLLAFVPYGADFLVTVGNLQRVTATHYFNSAPIVLLWSLFQGLGVRDAATAEALGAALRHALDAAFLLAVAGCLLWKLDGVATLVRRLGACFTLLFLLVTTYMWPHYLCLALLLAALTPCAPGVAAALAASGTLPYLHVFALLGSASTRQTVGILAAIYGIPLLVEVIAGLRRRL